MRRGGPDLWVAKCPTCGIERYFTPHTEDEQDCSMCRPLPPDPTKPAASTVEGS